MATPDGRTPKTRGSHFGNGDATARQETTNRPDVQAPVPTMQASAPRPAMGGRRVSSRTAAATRRAGAHHVQRESRSGGRNLAPFLVLGLVTSTLASLSLMVIIPVVVGAVLVVRDGIRLRARWWRNAGVAVANGISNGLMIALVFALMFSCTSGLGRGGYMGYPYYW